MAYSSKHFLRVGGSGASETYAAIEERIRRRIASERGIADREAKYPDMGVGGQVSANVVLAYQNERITHHFEALAGQIDVIGELDRAGDVKTAARLRRELKAAGRTPVKKEEK